MSDQNLVIHTTTEALLLKDEDAKRRKCEALARAKAEVEKVRRRKCEEVALKKAEIEKMVELQDWHCTEQLYCLTFERIARTTLANMTSADFAALSDEEFRALELLVERAAVHKQRQGLFLAAPALLCIPLFGWLTLCMMFSKKTYYWDRDGGPVLRDGFPSFRYHDTKKLLKERDGDNYFSAILPRLREQFNA
ncbi:MAG: hypothetical protein A3I44_02355 [Candidatus Sungbacteria bacterium RIFCSPLOWO2_02_FULL_51_17]|uniref:Uncharacterized protein n=1 Tax=Candidatus Sungbacteria bacterium RIFCSPHIGHO2_02_FULL_51_29 TaxID=1802273 RepID=A0A1G2KT57_9BACT|nr:MAG: hypothetical protein A2676_02030 [Candidatus Sungbacteria bacterium RIFCSPHIGHO2_01_FULL_51_22]OHA02620.1 MAG: hypothetical protein A3C16_00195 [Candidatus Sungbacteria bacterium RIFCSPHIGHO2_02_FULL_51_29]OHA06101.1 MAG: hypothetical protein A3B29_02520 [Candidatus Sungbacteria bacterium RIFCSPLOWO2_01_FULL_51_34]OHA12035.1 MAG: hypothetical protein A3I44_02355 [Candidatus Sungbacteria bacterium RIFCSPLOWO2_02_FULL_51_17]